MIRALAVLALLLGGSGVASASPDIETLVKADVLIGAGTKDFCSGVAITENLVLTADHCFAPRAPAGLHITKGVNHWNAKVVAEDKAGDEAIVQVTDKSWSPLAVAKLAPENYIRHYGEKVFIIANPGIELTDSVTDGIVSAPSRTIQIPGYSNMQALFQVTAKAVPGSSGGMVVNSSGLVIGTVTAIDEAFTYPAPSATAWKLLRKIGRRVDGGPVFVLAKAEDNRGLPPAESRLVKIKHHCRACQTPVDMSFLFEGGSNSPFVILLSLALHIAFGL